jgi:hypothetical protein
MTELSAEQTKRLERLSQRPASEIDLSDMPETTNWEGAMRGQRPAYPRAELTAEQREQLERLSKMRDEDIDFSDIPEITNWEGAVRGWENHPARAQNRVHLHLSAQLERRLKELAQREGISKEALVQKFLLERTYQEEVRLGILPDSSAR